MPLSSIFEIGKRSLLTYQSAINTTSGNIANINNSYYARRRPDFSTLSAGLNASGLSARQSERLRNQFAEQQLYREKQQLGRFETSNMLLKQMEGIFAENTDGGLSNLLSEFWDSWNNLAQEPESQAARTIVKNKGVMLANGFRRVHGELKQLQEQIQPEIQSKTAEINNILKQLRDINREIRLTGQPEMMDERDRLLDSLSEKLNIDVKELDTGEVRVYADGLILVSDDQVNELRLETSIEDGFNKVSIYYANSDRQMNIDAGELGAMLDVHNAQLPKYLSQLDTLAKNLAESVNNIHRNGENLDGTTDIPFFKEGINGAADFEVNTAIVNDPSLIATRAPGEAEGSSSIARSIYDLQYDTIINDTSPAEFYRDLTVTLGNEVQETDYLRSSQKLIVEHVQNQKDAISGVSLDEEMTKMIQYEQSYQAASKIISMVDEMVQSLLNIR